MKKNKRTEALKQGVQPAAQALGDDDLMDVTGGMIFWRWKPGTVSGCCKEYGVFLYHGLSWFDSREDAEAASAALASERRGQRGGRRRAL